MKRCLPKGNKNLGMQTPELLKADFHTHPLGDRYHNHPCRELSAIDKEDISRFLQAMASSGLHLIACTDHHSVVSGLWAREQAVLKKFPYIVIPGAEISVLGATQRIHLLALNIRTDISSRQLTLSEAAREIHRQGGVAILAHPVKYPHEISRNQELLYDLDGIETNNFSEGEFSVEHYLDRKSCYRDKFILQASGSDLHWNPENDHTFNVKRTRFSFGVPVRWLLEKGVIGAGELAKIGL